MGLVQSFTGQIPYLMSTSRNTPGFTFYASTKIKVYETLILSDFKTTPKSKKADWMYSKNCVRKIEGVSWRDRVRHKDIRSRTDLSLGTVDCIQQRICHFGHTLRMDDTTYPKLAFFGYVHGKRSYKKAKEEAGNHGEVWHLNCGFSLDLETEMVRVHDVQRRRIL